MRRPLPAAEVCQPRPAVPSEQLRIVWLVPVNLGPLSERPLAGRDGGTPPAPEMIPAGTPEAQLPGAGGELARLSSVTISICGVPAAKARDVVKVAVIPLAGAGANVELDVTIQADGGLGGIPKETLNLVVLEGLRQLGIANVSVKPQGTEKE